MLPKLLMLFPLLLNAQPQPRPGAAGDPIPGLTSAELALFQQGKITFEETETVDGGLGPRFNLDSCAGCHVHPAAGGGSPAVNPQFAMATRLGAANTVPGFLTPDGPIRVVRFKRNPDRSRDGGVHALFTIAGRSDAPAGCRVAQEDFSNTNNLSFRIPTPLFGAGLMEAIPDRALRDNLNADAARKRQLGIRGRFNVSANDGTITRFGWKAQNKSLAIFAGEAYNVEMGVTNELFPAERDDSPECAGAGPEDHTGFQGGTASDVGLLTVFMRFLAPPPPTPSTPAIDSGSRLFEQVGCALCHTPVLNTGNSSTVALARRPVRLYSDLAVHGMGQALNDDIQQGVAGPNDWRTAPLWGLGQRKFYLHDGRTGDLSAAIDAHASQGSEATQVVNAYRALTDAQKQDMLTFLRSL